MKSFASFHARLIPSDEVERVLMAVLVDSNFHAMTVVYRLRAFDAIVKLLESLNAGCTLGSQVRERVKHSHSDSKVRFVASTLLLLLVNETLAPCIGGSWCVYACVCPRSI